MSGRKDDNGKAPWHLLPWDATEAIVKVLAFGAAKYGERNWEEGIKYSRVKSALDRHIKAWWQDGIDNDPETGLPHLAHAGCCVMFLLAFHVRGRKDLDDRPNVKVREGRAKVYKDDEGREIRVGDTVFGKAYQGDVEVLELEPDGRITVRLLDRPGHVHSWNCFNLSRVNPAYRKGDPEGPRAFDDKGRELKVGDKFYISDPEPKYEVKRIEKGNPGESIIFDASDFKWYAHSSVPYAMRSRLGILKAT